MRRAQVASVVLGLVVTAATALAARPLGDVLREELRIHTAILHDQLEELDRHDAKAQEAWVRVQNGSADILRAHDQGESLDSLRLRDEDLREAEAELLMHLFEAQRLRRSLMTTRAVIEETEAELRRLERSSRQAGDLLSGAWRVVVEPGGQEGVLDLRLDGTLVQGTYALDGGWSGSLRGTLVAGKVRLERVDSQLGFAAIFYGRLERAGRETRLHGNWEATQLAAGLASSGTWVAVRLEEEIGAGGG